MAFIASSGASDGTQNGASTTIAIALGAAVSVGDTIVGMAGWGSLTTTISGVADSLGNVYTVQSNLITDTVGGQRGQTWFSPVTVAGTPTITVTFSSSPAFRRIIVGAWSGLNATPADGTVGNWQTTPGTGTDATTSTAITPTVDGDTVIGFHQNTGEGSPGTGTITAGTNFTSRQTANAILKMEDLTQAAAGSIAGTFTLSTGHASITHVSAFKAATGGVLQPWQFKASMGSMVAQ